MFFKNSLFDSGNFVVQTKIATRPSSAVPQVMKTQYSTESLASIISVVHLYNKGYYLPCKMFHEMIIITIWKANHPYLPLRS